MNTRKLISGILIGTFFSFFGTIAYASILQGFQGGTGYGSATSSNVGQALIVASTSPYLTYTFGSSGGASGGLASTTPFVIGDLAVVSSSGALSTIPTSTYYLSTNPSGFITFASSGIWTSAITHTATTTFASSTILSGSVSSTEANALLYANASGILGSYGGSSCGIGNAVSSISATGVATCSSFLGSYTVSAGTGISVSTTTTSATITNTGVLSFNGATGTVTGVGSLGGATGTISVGAYLSGGSTLTVSSTLASSSWKFVIGNATTTASTTNYTEWTTDQTVKITNLLCKDTVGTTTLNIFVPTSYATTTVSSTIASSFACGISSHSSSTNLTFPINTPIITEVSSTAGTPVATPVQISYTKE